MSQREKRLRKLSEAFGSIASMLERDIVKHAACAAAMSCSGLEPGPSSKRDLNV